jgi:transcriptional regulator with PAS, ATPase and Fis domain
MISVMSNYRIDENCLPNYIIYSKEKIKAILRIEQQFLNKNNLKDILENTEKEVISKYLAYYSNSLPSKKKIANILGISLASLYNRISKYKIEY